MTVQSPLFSTSHTHLEQGGSGLVRAPAAVGGGPPATATLAKSGAFYDYHHHHLSDSNKATLYSTTSHTKATVYGVHDDSLELFYDSVKGSDGNSCDDALGKPTATDGSHSASTSSPVSNIYCSVQDLIATPPSKLLTSSSTEDTTPSTTHTANTALNATPSPHPYQLGKVLYIYSTVYVMQSNVHYSIIFLHIFLSLSIGGGHLRIVFVSLQLKVAG